MKTIIITDNGPLRIIADSALGRNCHPWFLPEFGSRWTWHSAPALRISRLGKGVRAEYAGRYVEERTLAWIPQAENNPAADFMDGALVLGDWIPLGERGLTADERDAIVFAARYSTIKQGDVLILDSDAAVSRPIRIGDKILLELDGRNVVDLRIK